MAFVAATRVTRGAVSGIPGPSGDDKERVIPREDEEKLFRAAFEGSTIGIGVIEFGEDLQPERVVRVNPALSEITGFSEDQLIGSGTSILGLDRWSREAEAVRATGEEVSKVEFEHTFERPDGSRIWVMVTLSPTTGAEGAPGRYRLAQIQDISERRDYQARLQFLAQHDPLTGLVNARRFHEIVDHGIAYQKRYGGEASLISFDLDQFKLVNDSCGHASGDEALQNFAAILVDRCRETDTISRLGGDEFAVFLPGTDAADAMNVAAGILEYLGTHPLEIDRAGLGSITLSTSGGVTDLNGREDVSARDLLAEADSGLYSAKRGGRNQVVEFRSAEDPSTTQSERLTWAGRTRRALENEGLFLEAQPIFDQRAGEVIRWEALLRMNDPDAGVVFPPTFLYTAERFGLSAEIDEWVVGSVIEALAESPDESLQVAVNLTAASLDYTSDLPGRLPNILEQAGVDPRRLSFELTEGTCLTNIERARLFIEQMREIGCRVAIDDFGAGFGSFYYLKALSVDIIKIGGEFVRSVLSSEEDRLILRAMSDMANGLGIEVVAEFVTDRKTAEACWKQGIDQVQGLFAGPTVPLREALGLE